MRSLSRIIIFLVPILLFVACVPQAVESPATRNENPSSFPSAGISVAPPSDASQQPGPVFQQRPVIVPVNTPLSNETTNVLIARPVKTPAAQSAAHAPADSTISLPAEDLKLELKLGRRVVAANPYPLTETPVEKLDIFVHLPPSAARKGPLRILLILHGMGGRGDKFAQPFIADADRNNWVIIAPTMPYTRDYMDPAQLVEEDLYLGHSLHAMLDALPDRLALKLRKHILLFGFSRGAQLATRFALFHPDYIETVAAVSGGSYTLPMKSGDDKQAMRFPFGIADLQQKLGVPFDWERFKSITFWIAVGNKDNRQGDVARAFDPYIGCTRVERAQKFQAALAKIGIDARLAIFQNADHEVTDEMRSTGLKFLREDELADQLDD